MKITMEPKGRSRYQKMRVFVWPAESILENLFERTDRPSRTWRKEVLPKVFEQVGLPAGTKARWSQYAGCTCPCSPGFILDVTLGSNDIHVTLEKESDNATQNNLA